MWVWAGGRVLNPSSEAEWFPKIKDLHPTDICLVLNDNTKPGNKDFHLFQPPERIAYVCNAMHNMGITPHLMSWIVPAEAFLRAAAEALIPLCRSAGVQSLQFDAEEPWTRWVHGADHAAVVQRVFAPLFTANKPCQLGVNGIVYHSREKLEPLIRCCDYVVPQAYSICSTHSVYAPGVTQRLGHDKWKGYGKPMVMGLAAYKQDGAGGLPTAAALEKAFQAVEDLDGPRVDGVCYWSLANMSHSKATWSFVKEKAARARTT